MPLVNIVSSASMLRGRLRSRMHKKVPDSGLRYGLTLLLVPWSWVLHLSLSHPLIQMPDILILFMEILSSVGDLAGLLFV